MIVILSLSDEKSKSLPSISFVFRSKNSKPSSSFMSASRAFSTLSQDAAQPLCINPGFLSHSPMKNEREKWICQYRTAFINSDNHWTNAPISAHSAHCSWVSFCAATNAIKATSRNPIKQLKVKRAMISTLKTREMDVSRYQREEPRQATRKLCGWDGANAKMTAANDRLQNDHDIFFARKTTKEPVPWQQWILRFCCVVTSNTTAADSDTTCHHSTRILCLPVH